jgi:hypothetical protein
MLRTCLLAALFLSATMPAGVAHQSKTSSWSSEKMRLAPQPRPMLPTLPRYEPSGNCAGLTVTIKAGMERLKALQEKATQAQWPPPSIAAQWAKRPLSGDIARQREEIARLNAALRAKGCQAVDVGEELRRAPAAKARTK